VTDGELILVAGALLAGGLAASLLAGQLRVPSLLLFLGIGMAIGSDGTGWIDFGDYELARSIGVAALALILFEGGLGSGFTELRPVLRASVLLALAATVLTALLTGVIAWAIFDISHLEGMLLGSILAATDGAAIFALLRGSALRRRLTRTLEGEAGLNDPVAVLLVIGFVEWIRGPDYGIEDMALLFVRQLSIGAAAGLATGLLAVALLRRWQLSGAGLYPVASLAAAACGYGLADVLSGSGFLAVYLTGLLLGSMHIPARHTVDAFHQGAAWVAQIAVFLTLGLLVFPAQLGDVWVEGTVVGLVSIVVARPLAVLVATVAEGFDLRERVLLGWAGLRGAIPVVLATFPVIADIGGGERLFNIVFFAVVLSTVLQGVSIEPLVRYLDVTTSRPSLPRPVGDTGSMGRLGAELVEWQVSPGDAVVGARVRELGLPRTALVTLIVRGDQALPPRGSTVVEPGDTLQILVRTDDAHRLPGLFDQWRSGRLPGVDR
jgi:cell volume regulation protein A